MLDLFGKAFSSSKQNDTVLAICRSPQHTPSAKLHGVLPISTSWQARRKHRCRGCERTPTFRGGKGAAKKRSCWPRHRHGIALIAAWTRSIYRAVALITSALVWPLGHVMLSQSDNSPANQVKGSRTNINATTEATMMRHLTHRCALLLYATFICICSWNVCVEDYTDLGYTTTSLHYGQCWSTRKAVASIAAKR